MDRSGHDVDQESSNQSGSGKLDLTQRARQKSIDSDNVAKAAAAEEVNKQEMEKKQQDAQEEKTKREAEEAKLAKKAAQQAVKREVEEARVAIEKKESVAQRQAAEKAERERQEARSKRQMELQKMTSKEALNAHLGFKLSEEIKQLANKREEGTRVAAAIDAEIASLEQDHKRQQETVSSHIVVQQEAVSSLKTIVRLFSQLEESSMNLSGEVNEANEASARQLAAVHSISDRIREEHSQAVERSRGAEARKTKLDNELEKLVTQTEAAEKAVKIELQTLVNEGIAKRQQAQLAEQHYHVLKNELAVLVAAEAEVKRHEAKAARIEEMRSQLKELKVQLDADESSIAALTRRQGRVESESTEANRATERKADLYEAHLARAQQLGEMQRAFVAAQLEAASQDVPAATKYELEKSVAFVEALHQNCLAELAQLKEDKAASANAAAQRELERKAELRQLSAERQAVSAAHAERQRFFDESSRQLEQAEKDLVSGAVSIQGRDCCIHLLEQDAAAAQRAFEKSNDEASAADCAVKAKTAALASLQSKSKTELGALRSQSDSELSVVVEQRKYVAQLQERLDVVESQAGAEDDTIARERGVTLVCGNTAAVTAHLKQLKEDLSHAEEEHKASVLKLRELDAQMAGKAKTLREQLDATREAVAQLTGHEGGFLKLLGCSTVEDASTVVALDLTTSMSPPAQQGDEFDRLKSCMESPCKVIDDVASTVTSSREDA